MEGFVIDEESLNHNWDIVCPGARWNISGYFSQDSPVTTQLPFEERRTRTGEILRRKIILYHHRVWIWIVYNDGLKRFIDCRIPIFLHMRLGNGRSISDAIVRQQLG